MNKLIGLLKLSHAIETGAINAYKGHIESLNGEDALAIRLIQFEEKNHRDTLARYLYLYDSRPSTVLDFIIGSIGSIMGLLCKILGHRLPMYGAGLIETLGVVNYNVVAKVADDQGELGLSQKLYDMAVAELRHKNYFKSKYE